jgi:hypothetical protein
MPTEKNLRKHISCREREIEEDRWREREIEEDRGS